MSGTDDDQLREALARRATPGLSEADRANVLRAARVRALEPRRRFVPRIAGWLAAAAAAVVIVIVAAPVLLNSPVPAARASSSPAPSPTHIYSAQQLSDMIGDPSWVGQTVLAEAKLGPAEMPPGASCQPPTPCPEAFLDGVAGDQRVSLSWRDAPYPTGTEYTDETGTHWAQKVQIPENVGVYAFTVDQNDADFLGPAQLAADGSPLAVRDVPTNSEQTPTDNVYVVSGWWWSGFWPTCPVPGQVEQTPQPEIDYFCQGSWITPTRPDNTQITTTIDGALELPSGPYPPWSDQQSPSAPVQGVFLVRSAGCQIVLEPECPVWRLLGRLDTESPNTPSPAPTPELSTSSGGGVTVHTGADLVAMIGNPDWIGRTVLATTAIDPVDTYLCTDPPQPCILGELDLDAGSPPSFPVAGVGHVVTADWRDVPAGTGQSYADDFGEHWVEPLLPPFGVGTFAFKIDQRDVEYLGPAQLSADGTALDVDDIPVSQETTATDNVYVVHGWWVDGLWPNCPMPEQASETPKPDISWYCGGSWITDKAETQASMGDFLTGLEINTGPYPVWDISPRTPVEGTYLVRSAGCQIVLAPNCPVWRILGRVDDANTSAVAPTPLPSFATADLGDVSIEYPPGWNLSKLGNPQHYTTVEAFITSPGARAEETCGPDYIPGAGGCSDSYSIPSGSIAIAVVENDEPLPPGQSAIQEAIDQGWQSSNLDGEPAAHTATYVGGLAPASAHTAAWLVAAPNNPNLRYQINVSDNGIDAGLTQLTEQIVGSFRFNAVSPTPTNLPSSGLKGSGSAAVIISLADAVERAREHTPGSATVYGYAEGSFRDLTDMFPGGVVQPPDGVTWNTTCWSVVFEGNIQITDPLGGAVGTPRPALTAVYVDASDGDFLMSSTYSPGDGPLPTPFFAVETVYPGP